MKERRASKESALRLRPLLSADYLSVYILRWHDWSAREKVSAFPLLAGTKRSVHRLADTDVVGTAQLSGCKRPVQASASRHRHRKSKRRWSIDLLT